LAFIYLGWNLFFSLFHQGEIKKNITGIEKLFNRGENLQSKHPGSMNQQQVSSILHPASSN
jgi:hypothetical protein